MGGKYTEAQKRATLEYIREKTDEFKIRAPKGTKVRWKSEADKQGKSLNQFVIDCVENKIDK